jgi:hypothetical protein
LQEELLDEGEEKASRVSDLTVRLEGDEGVRECLGGVTSGGFDEMATPQIDRIVSTLPRTFSELYKRDIQQSLSHTLKQGTLP